MRKLTGFVIALLLGIAGAVVFDGRTARADHTYNHWVSDPRAMHTQAISALNQGDRARYKEYRGLLETIANNESTLRGYSRHFGRAATARWLLNDLPPFDQEPDISYEGGGGEADY